MSVDARIFGFDSWTVAVTEIVAGTRENHRNRVVICTARRGIDPRWFDRGTDSKNRSDRKKAQVAVGVCVRALYREHYVSLDGQSATVTQRILRLSAIGGGKFARNVGTCPILSIFSLPLSLFNRLKKIDFGVTFEG